jgi:hypothetical protein
MGHHINITEQRFGKLIVKKYYEKGKWECVCDCGNIVYVLKSNLNRKNTTSCGCYRKEKMSQLGRENLLDIKNIRFGKLIVLGLFQITKNGALWNCQCDCGNFIIVYGDKLRKGETKSCGCIRLDDLKGKVFGKLIVNSQEGFDKWGSSLWLCFCECGNKIIVKSGNLKNGHTKSCGCLNESFIASETKKYFIKKYNAKIEYKIFINPDTNQWLRYDIYINPYVFIEINGRQHYELGGFHFLQSEKNNTNPKDEFEYQKKKDRMKRKFARKNGTYIEVDLRKIKTVEQAIIYIENSLRLKGVFIYKKEVIE